MIRRTTLIVVAIFLALVGLLLWQQSMHKDELEPTPTAQANIFDFELNRIQMIAVEDQDRKQVELERTADGNWLLKTPSGEIDPNADVATKVDLLAALRALSVLETPPGLAAMGLENPAYTITLTLDDGSQHRVEVGDITPTSRGYYIRVDGGKFYIVDQLTVDDITGWVETPPVVVATSTPTETVEAEQFTPTNTP